MPCLGDWKEFSDMVVAGIRNAQKETVRQSSNSTLHTTHSTSHTSNLFSIELNLEGRNVLVVGGGRIALRKVKTLLPTGAHITVVAPQLDPEFTTIPSIVLKSRPYEPLDLRGIFMVFICTDKPAVNAQVSNDARARRILVNNACDYLDGDFIVPARMDFGENIAVTVSTQGRAPSLAKKLKQKIQFEWAEGLEQVEHVFLNS
jgi:precorrin-2 dehydrogenase/sirohydrochlorin ferrochelatase